MFVVRWLKRLRAAHGLAFAMAAGQRPDVADLEDAGLDPIDGKLFEARRADVAMDRLEEPTLAAADEGPSRAVAPTFGLTGLSLASGQAAD